MRRFFIVIGILALFATNTVTSADHADSVVYTGDDDDLEWVGGYHEPFNFDYHYDFMMNSCGLNGSARAYNNTGVDNYVATSKYHPSLDMNATNDSGAVVYAIADGVVHHIQTNFGGLGNAVFITHTSSNGAEFSVGYGHVLHSVSDGQEVLRGQEIGVLATASWSHLHFTINSDSTATTGGTLPCSSWPTGQEPELGGFVDPNTFLVANPIGSSASTGSDFVIRTGNAYHKDINFDGVVDSSIVLGNSDSLALIGHVDSDSVADLVVRVGNTYHVDIGFDGSVQHAITLGNSDSEAWLMNVDGVGSDDLVLRIGNVFHKDLSFDGIVDASIPLGNSNSKALLGYVDGDAVADLVVRVGNTYHVDLGFDGSVNHAITLGNSDSDAWIFNLDGVGHDDLIVRVGNVYHKDLGFDGVVDVSVALGNTDSMAHIAYVNGDNIADLVVRVGNTYHVDLGFDGVVDHSITLGNSDSQSWVIDLDGS